MFRSNRAVRALSVFYKIFGIFCVLWGMFWAFFVYYCLIEPTSISITGFGVLCVIVGISGVVVALGEIRLLRRMESMQAILSSITDTPISVIAATWGVSVEKAEKLVQTMIRRKHLRKVGVDLVNHRIVPFSKLYYGENSYRRADLNIHQAKEVPVMAEVECEHCGALNTIEKGRRGRCEYCDSVIEIK